MSDRGKFLIFCIEQYRASKGLTGRDVIALFNEYGVADYIYDCFGALHTTGTQYMVDDIDQFIKQRMSQERYLL